LEMGIEPYQVTSSIWGVINQRLVRRLCPACKRKTEGTVFEPAGCDRCLGTGYRGRVLVAEGLQLDGPLRRAILAKADLDQLQSVLGERGHVSIAEAGRPLVYEGITSQEELNRIGGSLGVDAGQGPLAEQDQRTTNNQ